VCRDACLLLYRVLYSAGADPHSTPWRRVPVWKIGSAVRPHQRNAGPGHRAAEGRGVADRWSLSRMARLRAASFGNREAFGPFVLVECVQGDVEAIRFVAESGQRPGRLDSGLGSGIAGVDAQKFRIITRGACSSHKGLPSSSRCWIRRYATLAMSIARHLSGSCANFVIGVTQGEKLRACGGERSRRGRTSGA